MSQTKVNNLDVPTLKKEFKKLLETLSRQTGLSLREVFRDFCEIAAVTISNSVDRRHFKVREARYFEIIKRYERNQLDVFANIYANFVLILDELCKVGIEDVLGNMSGEMEMLDKAKGQFFTPDSVSALMTHLSMPDLKQMLQDKDFITVYEPTSGSGGTVLQVVQHFIRSGVNHSHHLHCVAQDIDLMCVHMTYIQLSLYGVPAIVIHGNTLENEIRSEWKTPIHCVYGWDYKLKHYPDGGKSKKQKDELSIENLMELVNLDEKNLPKHEEKLEQASEAEKDKLILKGMLPLDPRQKDFFS